MKKMVTRGDFVRGFIRILMISALAFIAVSLGTRAVTGEKNCSGCPGKGVCRGEDDCPSYKKKEE
jgi:hypothetical protein